MAATIAEIREAFKNTISVTGLRVLGTWPDTTVGDSLILVPVSGDYLFTLSQTATKYQMSAVLLVNVGTTLIRAQERMDAYLSGDGDLSIRAALRTDPTLGGVVDDIIVRSFTEYGTVKETNAEVEWLTARILMEIWV